MSKLVLFALLLAAPLWGQETPLTRLERIESLCEIQGAIIKEIESRTDSLTSRLDSLERMIDGARVVAVQDSGWFRTEPAAKPDSFYLPFTRYEIRWGGQDE